MAKIHVGLILEDAGLLQAILENEGFSVIDLSQRELISARDADAFIVRVPDEHIEVVIKELLGQNISGERIIVQSLNSHCGLDAVSIWGTVFDQLGDHHNWNELLKKISQASKSKSKK